MTDRQVFMIAVGEITPDPEQPRKTFNQEDVDSMASTLASQGVINPIEIDGDNVIVTGQLRWMAAEKAGLGEVPCTLWEGGVGERFERQVVENLNHHELTNIERENAIMKLWATEGYPTMTALGKAVGLSQIRISEIINASKFRSETPETLAAKVSTRAITDTEGLDEKQRVKILKSVETGKIKGQDIREIKKIAKVSDALLNKTLEGAISLERATQTAKTIIKIEEETPLTNAQKNLYVDRIEKDEGTIEKYKAAVDEGIIEVMTATPTERAELQRRPPAGRDSPIDKFTAVRDQVENLASYLGGCDADERAWARRILIDVRTEVDRIIGMIRAPK